MVTIRLNTWVDAPVERCFRLATSVDFHIASALPMKEQVVGAAPGGLMREGQTITWRGRHFGVALNHSTRMEVCRPVSYFRDVMVAGVFKHYEHEHHFAVMDDGTRVRDELRFAAPLGPLGRMAEELVLRRYMMRLLTWRNAALKRVAESEEWHKYLNEATAVVIPEKSRPGSSMALERGLHG